jgi:hypothetical protein
MPADLAAINAALRTTWTSTEVEEQLYQDAPTLSEIERDGGRFKVGDVAKTPIHVSRNGGFTALGDNETTLNTAGNQGHDKATWTYKHLYQPIEVTDQALAVTSSDAASVVNVLDAEVKGGVNDLRHQIERMLFASADANISGIGTTGTTTNTLTLDAAGVSAIQRSFLTLGSQIDIGTSASPSTVAAGRTITGIPAANQITIDGAAVSVTAGTHNIYWKGSRTGSSTSREITSLRSIVSTTGVIGNIDPATQPVWKSPFADTTITNLSLPAIYSLTTNVLNQGNASARPDMIVINPTQQQILFQQLQTQMRFTGNEVSVGDPSKVTIPGIPTITIDPLCPDTQVYALSKKHLFLLEESKPYWFNERFGSGGILSPVPGTVKLQGVLGYHINLGTDARNAHSGLFALATS